MSAVLLTLGRLPKALDPARSFAKLGWRVIVADPFAQHLTGASRACARSVKVPSPADDPQSWLEAIEAIAREEQVRLILPVSEETLYASYLKKRLPDVVIFTMPPAALHEAHDKWRFAERAKALGLNVPETARADHAQASEIAARGDFVWKERRSCGGGGTKLVPQGASFDATERAIVQERVRGEELSSCSLCHEGQVRGTAIYRASVMSGTVAVAFTRVDDQGVEDFAARYAAATRWTGFLSFDFMRDAQGRAFAIECNPRLTSGVHFFETDDIAPAILAADAPLHLRKERDLQQFWSCLQEAQGTLPNVFAFAGRLRAMSQRRDVTFAPDDPMPLIGMPWTARDLLRRASRERVPMAVAASMDIGWSDLAEQMLEAA